MNKSIIRLLVLGLTITVYSCHKDTSTNNSLDLKQKSILNLIESYDLSTSIELTEDFDYNISLEEMESFLQEISLSEKQKLEREKQYNDLVEKMKVAYAKNDSKAYQELELELSQLYGDEELPTTLQEQIELDHLERVQQAEQYLEELKYANTKEDSVHISKLFEFTLPDANNSITSTKIETYQVTD